MVNPIREASPAVIPHLVLSDASAALRFYQRALGALETYRVSPRRGFIAHAELQVGDYRIVVSDEVPDRGQKSARTLGGSPILLLVYAQDVDALARRFVRAGGVIVQPLQNRFNGDRSGEFQDPEGYRWVLSQRIEDVSPEEMARRMSMSSR